MSMSFFFFHCQSVYHNNSHFYWIYIENKEIISYLKCPIMTMITCVKKRKTMAWWVFANRQESDSVALPYFVLDIIYICRKFYDWPIYLSITNMKMYNNTCCYFLKPWILVVEMVGLISLSMFSITFLAGIRKLTRIF